MVERLKVGQGGVIWEWLTRWAIVKAFVVDRRLKLDRVMAFCHY